jgi:D-xylose transport system substrate-binding protein
VSARSFTHDFSAMAAFRSLTAAGRGSLAVILPDVTSSTRYVELDAPDLTTAMTTAGLSAGDQIVQNAQGSDATQLTDAEVDVTKGARVLLVDPLDSGVGAEIENYAKSHGVAVIDYDRLTLGGKRSYYVSFDNLEVGRLLGRGLANCISSWHVSKPNVLVMRGAVTDSSATTFYQGYFDDVLQPYFSSGQYRDVAMTAGTWEPSTALGEFESAYAAHPDINAALIANDETATPIISYLRSTLHVAAKTFPTTGQDATLSGLQNVLAGYQCGTVYKPIYLEAQAAVALALYLRAHRSPPPTLVNGTTKDATADVLVPSVLLTPLWVTAANMKDTIVKDNFVPISQLCSGAYASVCAAAGIKAA